MKTNSWKVLLLAALAGVLGCAGASSSDAFGPVPASGEGGPALDASVTGSVPLDAGTGAVPSEAGVDAGPEAGFDSGIPIILDGGTPCVVGGVLEQEPNNNALQSNALNPTVCGTIVPGGESDFLRFRLKPSTTSFLLYFEGDVSLTVRVLSGGMVQIVTITHANGAEVPFVHGREYSIEVRSLDGQRQDWRVTLFEN